MFSNLMQTITHINLRKVFLFVPVLNGHCVLFFLLLLLFPNDNNTTGKKIIPKWVKKKTDADITSAHNIWQVNMWNETNMETQITMIEYTHSVTQWNFNGCEKAGHVKNVLNCFAFLNWTTQKKNELENRLAFSHSLSSRFVQE